MGRSISGRDIFLSFALVWSCSEAYRVPVVGVAMDEAGFHRELHYTVHFSHPFINADCVYVLQQFLPAAVYVSVDQLNDLVRLRKLSALYPGFVDIELPTEKAQPFLVLLKGSTKVKDAINLPIHFRYHAPREDGGFVTVDIPNPTMFMNCLDKDLIVQDLELNPGAKYCLHEDANNFVEYSGQLDDSTVIEGECEWKLVNTNYQLSSPLQAKIPVGNSKAYPAILYATIIVSWVISLWTVFRINTVPRRINAKLEEQRVLERKLKIK